MFGKILVYILFIVAAFGSIAYLIAATRKDSEKLQSLGRYFYYILTGGIIAIALYLLYNIGSHNFRFTYIWSYSSTNLPWYLLISSFYAGQEGSFMLWTLLLSLLGLFLIPYARKNGYESWVMGSYSFLIMLLLLIMIIKSPFTYIWESFPDQGLEVGFLPQEGRGLNPILQNYWIAIHPPILFIGYAAMTVPFVFAFAGLMKRDYQNWINIAYPWILFASGILGLGIMMGGFWAYETLGWGGFWAWDPVENASLHPWLIAVALVHTILVQKNTGGLLKTNIALAIIGFVLVLFATYLTRSGVLGEASVHSFVDPGQVVNILLVALMVIFTVGGFLVFFLRMKDMPKVTNGFKYNSKELWLSLGSIFLIGLTVIVIFGTIRPILPEFLVSTKAALEPDVYNTWATPFAIIILILNAVSVYINWRTASWSHVFKKIRLSLILSTIATIVSFLLGINNILYLILGWTGWFSLFVNIELIIKNIKTSPVRIGGFISHLGISILILGAIASGAYSVHKPLSLVYNRTQEALGYKFTLVEKRQIEKQYKDRQKFEYNVKIEKDNKASASIASPIVYWSDFNDFQTPFFEPGIKRYITKDLYLSPRTWDFDKMEPNPILKKGESAVVSFDSSISFTFVGFDMSKSHNQNQSMFSMGIIIDYSFDGRITKDTLYIEMNMSDSRMNPIPKIIPGTDIQIMVSGFHPKEEMSDTEIEFVIAKEVFYVDVSTKPFINLVWMGVIAVVFGFFISIVKNRNHFRKKINSQNKN